MTARAKRLDPWTAGLHPTRVLCSRALVNSGQIASDPAAPTRSLTATVGAQKHKFRQLL